MKNYFLLIQMGYLYLNILLLKCIEEKMLLIQIEEATSF